MSRTVLITGASRGIGRAAARRFAQEGYRVAIGYCRSEAAAQELSRELSLLTDVIAVRADIRRYDEVARMTAVAAEALGPIDVLVNNAGVASYGLFTELTLSEWDRVLGINLNGAVYACQCVLPDMVRRHSGCIVNVSSIWGLAGASCEVAYSAAKAGLVGLTKALAKEVGPAGIRVNCVAPGVIDTDMSAALDEQTREELAAETPLGRLGTPEEAAEAIVFLASDRASFLTGQVLSPNGGFLI